MENDTVRTLGDNTLVDIWIEGKSRAISISASAIEALKGSLSETERREFVRTNLSLVVRAATENLRSNPAADTILIEAGQLGGRASSSGERRSGGDRRKGDRRQRNAGPPGGVERRGR